MFSFSDHDHRVAPKTLVRHAVSLTRMDLVLKAVQVFTVPNIHFARAFIVIMDCQIAKPIRFSDELT